VVGFRSEVRAAQHIMPSIIETVRETIASHGMLRDGEKVLVAVSGGPDSMALLHILRELGFRVEIAHLDHGTRDGESARDADFVRDYAAVQDLPFHLEVHDIPIEATTAAQSFEVYARAVRYQFLARVAQERQCAAIATGHHANDQAETVMMRLFRGSSPHGLAGIPPVRMQGAIPVIRPLLRCSRRQLMDYLDVHSIPCRTDHSNSDQRFLRNRVRHHLLPLLHSEYNPQIYDALSRLAELQRDEDYVMEEQTTAFIACCVSAEGYVNRKSFSQGPVALQRRAFLRLGWKHGIDCPFALVESARWAILHASAGHSVSLGPEVRLLVTRYVAEFLRERANEPVDEIPLRIPGVTTAFEKVFSVRYRNATLEDEPAALCTSRLQVFDANRLGSSVAVRRRRAGDRFVPYGMTGSRKLKDYLSEMGMPITERTAQLVIVADGEIIWVVGRSIAARAAISSTTRNIVQIEVSDATV